MNSVRSSALKAQASQTWLPWLLMTRSVVPAAAVGADRGHQPALVGNQPRAQPQVGRALDAQRVLGAVVGGVGQRVHRRLALQVDDAQQPVRPGRAGRNHCGACTVEIDGAPARSCITFAAACVGLTVRTIEGFDDDPLMAALRQAARSTTAAPEIHHAD